MQSRFEQHLHRNFPFLFQQKFLIALSGGLDSVVLTKLCENLKLSFGLAHCNFQLRGKDSREDEDFVRQLGKKLNTETFIKRFDTRPEAGADASIQLLARKQRYDWFEELLQNENYDYILTAHHLDDDIETFFINFLRGTGLSGLAGIPAQNKKILRPLLNFSRAEIEVYAQENQLLWREDMTNQQDAYLRNRLRHHLIPLLEKENPKFRNSFALTRQNLQSVQDLNHDYKLKLEQELMTEQEGLRYYDCQKLSALPHLQSVLYLLFREYGFTSWRDIEELLSAEKAKQVLAPKYRLVKDRKHLVLGKIENPTKAVFLIEKEQKFLNFTGGKIKCQNVMKVTSFHSRKAYLAAGKLVFPLKLRIWQPGDRFKPLGMGGQRKVGEFLKDLKLNFFEKENTWVLLSENTIVWVVGHQINDDFKIDGDTHKIIKIEWLK